MPTEIKLVGPLFDGRASAAVKAFDTELRHEVAAEGKRMVLDTLHVVLQHPTGYYESQVQTQVRSALVDVVTDGGVIYGPWLEGTSARNQTTRFKGYATFRKVTDRLNARVLPIAHKLLGVYLERMN